MKDGKRIGVRQIILWSFLAVIIVLAIIFRDEISVDALLSLAPENLWLAVGFFMMLYALKSFTVVIPLVILYVSSGAVFGSWAAIGVNLCGGAICVTLPYLLGRSNSAGLLSSAKNKLPRQATNYFAAHPMSAFRKNVLLRAVGVVPSDATSYCMGAAGESFLGYLLGSVIGLLPDMIPQTLVGAAATDPSSSLFKWSLAAALTMKAAAIAASILIRRRTATE